MLRLVPTSTSSTSAARIELLWISRRSSVMPGWDERTGGKGLDGNSRCLERPGIAESIDNGGRVVSAAVSMEEAALAFQDLFGAGPAQGSEVGRNHTALARMARLKRLHHGAEVFAQTGGMAG